MSKIYNRHPKVLFTAAFLLLATGYSVNAKTILAPSAEYPYIMLAVIAAVADDTVMVLPGIYNEDIVLGNGIKLVSQVRYGAVLDGNKRKNVVTLNGSKCVLSGFEIRNGIFGVFTKGVGTVIEQCKISKNRESGILCIGNLPKIHNNIIAFNRGSGIKGCDLRASAFPTISFNTIVYNRNHGISIGGTFNIGIEKNILANNKRYGIKIMPENSNLTIESNCFFKNGITVNRNYMARTNESYDPCFRNARKLDFTPSAASNNMQQSYSHEIIGAQLYE